MTQTSASDTGQIISDNGLEHVGVTTVPGTKPLLNEYMDKWIQSETV